MTRYNLYGVLAVIAVFSAALVDQLFHHPDTIETHMPAPTVDCMTLAIQRYGIPGQGVGWHYWEDYYCGGIKYEREPIDIYFDPYIWIY